MCTGGYWDTNRTQLIGRKDEVLEPCFDEGLVRSRVQDFRLFWFVIKADYDSFRQ